MSPIDDELRAALRSRASELDPSPDPLAGIERRAKRIRRNRVASSVAASALAVAAIALVVPALSPSAAPDRTPPPLATAGPTLAPSPVPTASPALDLDAPWPYRGDQQVIGNGNLAVYTSEWAVREGVSEAEVDFVPLYGELFESSRQPILVYAARVKNSEKSEYGAVFSGEGGPEFLSTQPLTRSTTALLTPVPGDEVARLLVVAAPESQRLEYAGDGVSFAPMTAKAVGVGLTPLEGDTSGDKVRVVGSDGSEVFAGPAPELSFTSAPTQAIRLEWPSRGEQDDALVERAATGYATAKGVSRDQVEWEVLFTGSNDPGQRYTVLNAWVTGQPSQVFGWIETPGRDPEPQLQPLTQEDEPIVAILLTEIPGRTTDELVVIPQPATGEVFYRAAGGEYRPVTAPGLDGVALVDRDRGAEGDVLRLLDGNGDLDKPTFEGSVFDLLCGESGCG